MDGWPAEKDKDEDGEERQGMCRAGTVFFIMNNIITGIFFVIGVTLIISGMDVTHFLNLERHTFLTGPPSDNAVWMLVGGVITATVVLVWTLRNWKQD